MGVAPARAHHRPRLPEVAVAAGTLASQACVYVLSIAATHRLGPAQYGELASLLTITVIMSIPAMALQSWAARTIAVGGDTRAVLATTSRLAVVTTATTLAVVLLLAGDLEVAAVPSAVSAALLVFPVVWLTAAQGYLQGENRMVALGGVILASGIARVVGGLTGLALGVGAWPVVWGIGLGTVAVAGAAWILVLARSEVVRHGRVWLPVARIAAATGATWVLSNVDVVLARLALDPHRAGQYAAAALVARAVQFAPQFVMLSTFTGLTSLENSRRLLVVGAAKVLAIGATATALLAVVGPVVLPAVLGAAYQQAGRQAWVFAVLGTVMALNQLLVAQRVARNDEAAGLGVWFAVALLCLLVLGLPQPQVLTVVLAGVGVNVLLMAGMTVRVLVRP